MSLPSISIELCYCFPFLQQPTKFSNWLPPSFLSWPYILCSESVSLLVLLTFNTTTKTIQHPSQSTVKNKSKNRIPINFFTPPDSSLDATSRSTERHRNTTRQAKNEALYNPRYARIAIRIPELIWRWVCDRSIDLTFLEKSFDKNGFNCPH